MFGLPQQHQVMLDFYQLVYSYGLHPYVVHRAFLHIDEYQAVIKRMGCGPAKGELGHDPNISYGRVADFPVPEISERRIGPSFHVWPVTNARAAAPALTRGDRECPIRS
jgi:hypothetical protein